MIKAEDKNAFYIIIQVSGAGKIGYCFDIAENKSFTW